MVPPWLLEPIATLLPLFGLFLLLKMFFKIGNLSSSTSNRSSTSSSSLSRSIIPRSSGLYSALFGLSGLVGSSFSASSILVTLAFLV